MSNHEQQAAFVAPQRTPDLDMVSYVASLPPQQASKDDGSNNEMIRVMGFPFGWEPSLPA